MDLHQLKSLWETENRAQLPDEARRQEEIQAMLRGRSRTHWQRIRRNTILEMGLIVLAMLAVWAICRALHVFVFPLEWQLLWGLGGLGLMFYLFKYFALGQLPASDQDLLAFLQKRLNRLRTYLQLYRVLVVGFVPLLGAAGVLYGFVRESVWYDNVWPSLPWQSWTWVVAVMLAYAVLAAWGSTIYLRKMYGQHLAQLEANREELAAGKTDAGVREM